MPLLQLQRLYILDCCLPSAGAGCLASLCALLPETPLPSQIFTSNRSQQRNNREGSRETEQGGRNKRGDSRESVGTRCWVCTLYNGFIIRSCRCTWTQMTSGVLSDLQVTFSSLLLQKLVPNSRGGDFILDVVNSCNISGRCCRRCGTIRRRHSPCSAMPAAPQKNFRFFRE